MPPRRRLTSSTQRRHRKADEILTFGQIVMRPCAHCVASASLCVLSVVSEKYEQCHRFDRPCELASPWQEAAKLHRELEKVDAKFVEAEAKARRLYKQKRFI
jgi:hypothetical protein